MIGVLALQGDVREHLRALTACGARAITVRRPSEIDQLDRIVLPGGESTTIDKLSRRFGVREPLVAALRAEAPADKQALISDLFERITLYDVKTKSATATKRADGRWDVAVTVEARKLYADGQGVETEAQLALVAALGCTYGQGFHIARPMPAEDLSRWLRSRSRRRAVVAG